MPLPGEPVDRRKDHRGAAAVVDGQLSALGAILAFEHPNGSIKVVKDLRRRPVKLESEDIKKLNRIIWTDYKPQSVEGLARALGLDFVPKKFDALFPHEVELELLRKELAYHNKREDEIYETRFRIVVPGRGRPYDIIVTDQFLR
jgi:hypothetical protein